VGREFDVVVVGSINLDVVFRARRFPDVGETLTGATVLDALGGKGSNQAVAAARQGGRVAMVACVGDDAAGRTALDALRAEGVDVSHCRVNREAPTGRAAVIVSDAGDNSIVVADGANATLSIHDVERASDVLAATGVVLCQLEVPQEVVAAAFAAGRRGGALTCLNTAPAMPLDGLTTVPDVLVANRVEAGQLAATTERDGTSLARAVRDRFATRAVVVTDGAAGATGWDGDVAVRAEALPVQPVDTTAAGDAFVGGLAVRLAAGDSLGDALPHACAAGSLATLVAGAMPSLPSAREVAQALTGSGRAWR
jgi:ribokinase